MKIHIERKEGDEKLLSLCLQKQQQKPTLKELGIPALDSLYKQMMEGK